jgi:hypothetical protein
MKAIRSIRAAAAVAVMSTGILTGGLASVAGAKSTAKLFVAPSTGLTNGRSVTVKGTGFKPKDQLYITECLRTAKDATGCDTATAFPVTVSATGVLPATKFKLITGVIGNGKCGTKSTNLNKCAVSVGNINGRDTASANITFVLKR